MSGTIGEKLDQIIAEASAFSEFDVGTDDAFRLIVKLAQDAQGTADRMLERILLADRERLEIGASQLKIENLTGQLARAHQVQGYIRRERGYAEEGSRRYKARLDTVAAQLSALHDEFRTASARLRFVANWLENTYAKGTPDAGYARQYADIAKEVLDKGLDWLVERKRSRGRGVMDSTAASKTAGEGSSPSARASQRAQSHIRAAPDRGLADAEMMGSRPIQNDLDLCMLCSSGGWCVYASWNKTVLWEEITQRLAQLTAHGSSDVVWNVNEQRAILNLMWHYRKVD